MIAPVHTHTHTSVPALLTWQNSWYFIKIKYSEPNISAPASVSPLEHDWSTKPIIYIINNSFAFRYVTLQIWKYYGISGFVPNERGGIHEHKAPFRKQLSVQAFKVYSFLSVYVRDAFRISTWSLSRGLCFQVAVIKQRCIAAGAPFWIGGELPVFVVRPHQRWVVTSYIYFVTFTWVNFLGS